MKFADALRTLCFKEKLQGYHQLYTKWGEELDPQNVLPEYPRPQLKRENYTILNGYWDYAITETPDMPHQYDGKILVPFSPESVLSGVNRQLKPGEYLWYERRIKIDKKAGKRCILHFGAVDQYCEVYINKIKMTQHMGGYLPLSSDITPQLMEGDNTIQLKVTDDSETSYHSRGKQKLKRGGMFYTAQSGIWQTVWMEWVPDSYISSLRITPFFDQKKVEIVIAMNFGEEQEVHSQVVKADIRAEDKLLFSVEGRLPVITIPLKEYVAWTPENPYLYHVTLTVGEDKVESYFAMRKFELKKDREGIPRIFLNNQPYFMNGLLDQGYWPDGLYTAPSDEALQFDITEAKKLGFNMLRKHIKIEPLRFYYHCDRLGMIVWQDIVNGGEKYNMLLVGYLPTLFPGIAGRISDRHYRLFARGNPEGRNEWTRECSETVEHLYNCPCIAVWVPFNEGWGQFDAVKAVDRIKKLDPTRLIDHASGWFDQKAGDFNSIHNYFHPLTVHREERVIVFSEIGGYACYIPEHVYSMQIYGYRIYLTKNDLNEAFEQLYHEELKNLISKGLSAVVYTQLSDVEDEVNGLFTYDRKICKVKKISIK